MQTFVTGKITDQLSSQLQTKISVDGVDIDFFKKVVLEGIYLEDQQQDTLLYAERLRADIGIFALFGKEILLDEILLENAYINLYTVDDSATLNFAFIPEAFASDTTQQDTTAAAWDFDLRDIVLRNTRFNYHDHTTDMQMDLSVADFLVALETLGLEESHIKADAIRIDGLNFNFRQIAAANAAPDTTALEQATDTAQADLNPSGFMYSLDEFVIKDSHISFVTDTSATPGVNFANLDLVDLFLEIKDVKVGTNSLVGEVTRLGLLESNSGFRLKQLALNLGLDGPSLNADLSALEMNNTKLNGNVAVSLADMYSPDSLLNALALKAKFDSTRIGLTDISFFSPALDSFPNLKNMAVLLQGNIAVDSGNAFIDNLAVNVGETTSLAADATLRGIDALEDAYVDVNIRSFVSDMDFIGAFMPPGALPPSLRNAGGIRLNARAEGYLSDADLVANVNSDLGRIAANVNYRARSGGDFSTSGEVNAFRVNLGAITGNDSLGLTTLNSRFIADMQNGSFSADTLELNVKSLQYSDYTYEGLNLSASFLDSILYANLQYTDENLNFNIDADANLNVNNSSLVLNGDISEINLLRLNLSPDSIIISTKLDADFKNLDPDLVNGYFLLSNTTLIDGATKYGVDTVQLIAETGDTARSIIMNSDFINAQLQGNFSFAVLPMMVDNFIDYYFTASTDTIDFPVGQYLTLDVEILDEPMVVRAFMPDITLPQPSSIFMSYYADNHNLKVDLDVPEIHYMDYKIRALKLLADTKNEDNIRFGLTAGNIAIGDGLSIPNIGFEGSFIQDMMQFNLHIANSNEPNYLDLNGFLTHRQDTIILEILESNLAIKDDEWNIPEDANLQYAEGFLKVDNFLLTQNEQKISINTQDEFSENSKLNLEIQNFQVGELLTVFDMEEYEVEGALNGALNVTNVFELGSVKAAFGINNLVVNAQQAGNLSIEANKEPDQEAIFANVRMNGEFNDFSLEGTYNPVDTINMLDLRLAIAEFRLEQWGVFAEEFVSDLSGNIQAEMDITGSTSKPVVEGYFAFDPQSTMRINAIGSLYRMHDERITFSEQAIDLNNFVIFDSANHELSVRGEITHEYFTDFVLDLAVTTPEFKFFDAKQNNSPAYYGTVNAGTDLSIRGPIDNLEIDGSVTTKRGTALVIALVDDPDFASHAPFINFVNTNAYLAADGIADTVQVNRSTTAEISGISMNLLLRINKEARVDIVIDPLTGDKLVAVGEGDIDVEMSRTGDMNIQGTYILDRGSYSLSFMGLLKRQFDIRAGSTINLSGDPLDAGFNITAFYATEADPCELLPETGQDTECGDQPVNVVLELAGTLETPDIGFSVELPASRNDYSAAAQRLKMIQQDQTQLYQQVFGLIVLNRFIPATGGIPSGDGGGGAALVNQRVDASVSSILTTQLSRLTEDYLGGVELSVNLESQDANNAAFDNKDLQVQLSKQLFNERLTVTVGGTQSLGGEQSGVPGGDDTALMGDFEILYRINESGTLNLRIFQSNNRDIFTQEIRQRQGTSLTYVKSFDEIFVSERNKKVLRAE